MKKFILIILVFFSSYSIFSQMALEGFENTTGPDALPATSWTLGTGNWAVFDNGVGPLQRWGINNGVTVPPLVYAGANAAYINRENVGLGNTLQDYLATPDVLVPANGQLKFFTRSTLAGDQGSKYYIKVKPVSAGAQNDPAGYVLLQMYDENTLTTTYNIYEEKILSLSAYVGQHVYVAFEFEFTQPTASVGGDRWLVDNVKIVSQCLDPTTLTTTVVLATSATFGWANPGGATSFEIENMLATATPTGIATATATTNNYNQTGLTALTGYKYYVRALCANGEYSAWVGPFTYTTIDAGPTCGGNYVDSGGIASNYPNNSDSTITICPTTPGDLVTVTFTSFNTEATWDGLYVFDGGSIASPQIASANPAGNVPGGLAGSYWGTTIPGPFTSSSPDGCLTFRFRSDGAVNNPGWVANVTCAPPPTCQQPTALTTSAVLATTATFGWTNVGLATAWQVLALPCGSPAPNSSTTGWIDVATNSYTFTGLSGLTCYNFYVRGVCSTTDLSAWSGPKTATTQAVPPACGGVFMDAGGATANYPNSSDSTVTICPTTPGDLVTVTFTAFNTEATWDGLYVFNGNSIASPQIASTNPAGNVPGGLAGSYWGATIPGPFTSSSPDGCLTFRFRSDTSVNNPGWVSNVTCGPPPTCLQPITLTTSAVLATTATFGWTSVGVATAWQVLELPCGSPAPNATTTGWIDVATNSYTFTGLSGLTCYDFYVRGVCSTTDFSAWSGPKSATTQAVPPACGGVFTDAGGPSANYPNSSDSTVTICPTTPGEIVTVTFTSFNTEANWDGLYVFDGNSIASPQIASTNPAGNVPGGLAGSYWGTTIPGPFTSSSPDGCLTFRFRSDTSVNNPGWVSNVTCGPPPTCIKPTTLTALNITQTTANLSWNQLANPDLTIASQWEFLILPSGSPAPTATSTGWLPVTTNSFAVTGLTPGFCYSYYVRAVCTATDSSTWAGPFNFCELPPPPISSNTTQYNAQQLVENVLLNSTCANVTNVTFSTGTNFGSTNGIGYFQQNGSNFPFTDGVVLTTGDANSAPGPNTSTLSAGTTAWTGDADLEAIILAATGSAMNSRNASKLEFDFVPLTNAISFDFIFASEEYGTFQCTFSDAFAFLLTNVATGVTTNLAIVPNTTTPISVVTIRDQLYNTGCNSVNSQYFGQYNQLPGILPTASPTNFNGQTVVMTAGSPVIPNTQYHIKLVIADRSDNAYDSAVFLKGGSFDIGNVDLGNDLLQATGNAICNGGTQTISTTLDPALYTISWLNNGVLIPNQTSPTLTVTQSGTYTVQAQYINTTCSASDSIVVEFYAPIVPGTPNNLNYCSATGFGTFDLTQNTSLLLAPYPTGYTVGYFTTLIDANTNSNPILNVTNYTNISNPQTIYVRVQNTLTGCYVIDSFTISVQDLTPQFTLPANFSLCAGSTGIINVNPINFNSNSVTYAWTLNGVPLPDITSTINVSLSGIYEVTVNNSGCTSSQSVSVLINSINTPDFLPIPAFCSGAIAPILQPISPNGISGTWNPSVIDNLNNGNYVFTPTPGQCGVDQTLTVTIIPKLTPDFATIPDFCSGASVPTLELSSPNGISGTWIPAVIDNLTSGSYVFTPDSNQCANNQTVFITVLSNVTPDFVQIPSFCSGSVAPILLTTSPNGIIGTWNPAIVDNLASGTYLFLPNGNQCASTQLLSVSVVQSVTPDFASTLPFCSGSIVPTLDLTSPNGVNGTWNPTVIDNLTSGNYVFTPDANQCANTQTLSVTITPKLTPDFASIPPFCSGTAAPIFVLTSPNGVNGTWTPAVIDNLTSGNYVFTPDANQCANSQTLSVTIIPKLTPDFPQIPAICSGSTTPVLLTTSPNGVSGTWNPVVIDNLTSGNYVFTPDLNQCANPQQLSVTITPRLTPDFAQIPAICSGSAPILQTTSPNGVSGTWNPAVIDNLNSGNYVFTPDTNICANSQTLSVTITPKITPDFAQIPAICSGSVAPVFVVTSPNGVTGAWSPTVIDNLNSGTYLFTPNSNQCAYSLPLLVTVTPRTLPDFPQIPAICSGSTAPVLQTISPNGVSGTWNPTIVDTMNSQQYVFTPIIGSCASPQNLTTVINLTPNFEILGGCNGGNYKLEINPLNNSFNLANATFSWSSTLNTNFATSESVIINQAGIYNCNVTVNGCSNTAQPLNITNTACLIQKGLSPNGDGDNDVFDLSSMNVKMLSIYNRYGRKVYSLANYSNQWGGQSDAGEALPDATYYYVIEQQYGDLLSGWILINK